MDSALAKIDTIIELSREQLPSARYNAKTLEFLFLQMVKFEGLQMKESQGPALVQALHLCKQLEETLEQGELLIRRHAVRMGLQTFYKTSEANAKVTVICEGLKKHAETLMKGGFLLKDIEGIQTAVGGKRLATDKTYMFYYLSYILEGQKTAPNLNVFRLNEAAQEEWEDVKAEHEARMSNLPLIADAGTDKVQIGRMIGTGDCGVVYQGRWRNVDVAVKKFVDVHQELSPEALASFFTEVEIQKAMPYPHIVRVFAASKSGMMVMELGKCNMFEVYQSVSCLAWSLKAKLLLEAAQGLQFVHDQGVVHRDVKSFNFLIFDSSPGDFTVKVADFGLATVKTESRTRTARPQVTSSLWTAPEIYDGKLPSFRSDIYSFGVVMFEVVSQCAPYWGVGSSDLLIGQKRRGVDPCKVPEDCPDFLLGLMRSCISPDPCKRPTIAEVIFGLKELCLQFPNKHNDNQLDLSMKKSGALPYLLNSPVSPVSQRIPAGPMQGPPISTSGSVASSEMERTGLPVASPRDMVAASEKVVRKSITTVIEETSNKSANRPFPGQKSEESAYSMSSDGSNGPSVRFGFCGLLCFMSPKKKKTRM